MTHRSPARRLTDHYRGPERRARLPGRARLRELRSSPRQALTRPTVGLGRLGSSDRMIALMMIKDESDILEESLAVNRRWFDRILVLDGTVDPDEQERTTEILASFPEVVFHQRDQDLGLQPPAVDGWRQVLLTEARRRYGVNNWIGVLHGDEFFDQDPRPLLNARHPSADPVVRVRLVHAFLHTSDEARWPHPSELPTRERITHYMWPGVPESRFFFDRGTRDYDVSRHTKVVPASFRSGPLENGYMVVGYNERSPGQLQRRAQTRIESGWQRTHYQDATTPFVADLHQRSSLEFFDQPHLDPRYGKPSVRQEATLHLAGRARPAKSIFVGGTGRSGSTLTKTLLGNHPAIHALDREMKFVSWPAGLLDLVAHPRPRRLVRFRRRMLDFSPSSLPDANDQNVHNWGFRAAGGEPFDGYKEALHLLLRVLASRRSAQHHRATAAREFLHFMLDRRCSPTESHWVEQTPANVRMTDTLLKLVPDAVVIHVVRDPRNVVASLTRAWWGSSDPLENARLIKKVHQEWANARRNLDPTSRDRLIEVRFEEVLQHPHVALTPATEACDLPPLAPRTIHPPDQQPATFSDLDRETRRLVQQELQHLVDRLGYE